MFAVCSQARRGVRSLLPLRVEEVARDRRGGPPEGADEGWSLSACDRATTPIQPVSRQPLRIQPEDTAPSSGPPAHLLPRGEKDSPRRSMTLC